MSLGQRASLPLSCPYEGYGKEPWAEPSPTLLLPVCQWTANFSGSHPPCLYSGAVFCHCRPWLEVRLVNEKMICGVPYVGLARLQLPDSKGPQKWPGELLCGLELSG